MINERKYDEMLFGFSHKTKDGVWKFYYFFVNFLRCLSFGRIKVILIMIEREYTPNITRQIFFAYQLTGFNVIRSFIERCFLTGYFIYILENHFYFVYALDYCFKPSLSRIFCVNNSVKILSSWYKGPSTHLFRTSSLCTFFIYRKKEIGFVARFFSKYFLGQR